MFGFRCVLRPTAPPERSFAPLTLAAGSLARASAPVGDETYHVFMNLHPYTKSDLDAIVDGLKRVEDFDYPYEFIVRSGRAVIIPAYSGTLERGPTVLRLPAAEVTFVPSLPRSLRHFSSR